jgi:Fur family ferric uptake transcriptional regulator
MHPQYHQVVPQFMDMERATRQNTAIREAIEAAGRPLTPTEVLDEARRHVAALGLATVYRNLKALVDAGVVQVVTLPGEVPRYEKAQLHHHHHFRCDACQRVFDVLQCPGDLSSLAPPGFAVARHEITLYGLCSDCQPAVKTRARKKATAHGHDHSH